MRAPKPEDWTEEDERAWQKLIADRLPFACACLGRDPGEELCHCDKLRLEAVREVIAARR